MKKLRSKVELLELLLESIDAKLITGLCLLIKDLHSVYQRISECEREILLEIIEDNDPRTQEQRDFSYGRYYFPRKEVASRREYLRGLIKKYGENQ